jgi:predicted MFS family arabinose efflux permease
VNEEGKDRMSEAAAGATSRGWYRHYVLFVLTLVYVANFIDRQVLGILLEPIKREFGVSDSVLGLLAGPTFAIFYATIGLPLAYAADRMNRRNIIAASLAVFSVMTALCGLAAQFWQLALARIGVGIGEAGTSPQSHSILSDLYRPDERVGALAVLSIAPFIGIAIALLAGGWISQVYGWRTAFLIAGLPGVALAVLVLLTVREPKRGACEDLADTHAPPLFETVRFLWSQKSYVWFIAAFALVTYTMFAVQAFMPPLLERVHRLPRTEIGFLMAMLAGVGAGVGTLITGAIIARFAKRDVRWNAWGPMMGMGVSVILWPIGFLASDISSVTLAASLPFALTGIYLGPVYAMAQGLVPMRMRATSAAVMFFTVSVFGIGGGPLMTGIWSDLFRPDFGVESLRYALVLAPLGSLLSIGFFALAARRVREDLGRIGEKR